MLDKKKIDALTRVVKESICQRHSVPLPPLPPPIVGNGSILNTVKRWFT